MRKKELRDRVMNSFSKMLFNKPFKKLSDFEFNKFVVNYRAYEIDDRLSRGEKFTEQLRRSGD